ncbi:MFS transporter [Candidatus Solirubrobacter pratensis]|uniref:MFS transporter n=1 Tax=Candidatus Solirubrobacter pratensis TaxID=1298857 RepID=UPI00068902F4|nr:MFS transporter [Candidatus Solirubrobacter pratensis]
MRRYLLAAAACRLADAMWLAPILLVLDRTGSASLGGLTASAALLPTLVTAPLLGAWLDVAGRRRYAIAGNQVLLAAALTAMLAVPAPLMVPCAALAGLTQPLVTGGFSSMVASLVAPERLPRAAALDSMTYNVVNVAGPALAGGAAAAAGAHAAVGLQVALALAGLAAVLSLPRAVDGERAAEAPWPVLRAGASHLLRTPDLRAVTLITMLAQLPWGFMGVGAPALAAALGAGEEAGGLLLAAVAAGALAGAALAPALQARRGLLGLVAAGTFAQGLGLALLAAAPSPPSALAAAALTGAPQGVAIAALMTARSRWSPPHLRAQVFTSAAGLRTGVYAAGAALAGPVLAGPGARLGTLLAGVACVAAALSAPRASAPRRPAGTSAG